jgi:cell division protein FtsB
VAVGAIGYLATVLVERRREAAALRSLADDRTAETRRMRDEIARDEALRDGLKQDDPYVVEYLARERLRWTAPGEFAPPPATVDKGVRQR